MNLKMSSSSDLLTQADARPGVERKEYERVRHQVLSNALVNEPIRVKFLR